MSGRLNELAEQIDNITANMIGSSFSEDEVHVLQSKIRNLETTLATCEHSSRNGEPVSIHIGDSWVFVPPGYTQAEEDFCGELMAEWYANVYKDEIDEELRQKILDKRIEFYNLYKTNKVKIQPPTRKKRNTWWQNIWRNIRG